MATMKLVPVVVALGLSACVLPDVTDEGFSDVEQALIPTGCDEPGCGLNSPQIENFTFWDFNLDHVVNDQGFQFDNFEKSGWPFSLTVVGGRIKGNHPYWGTLTGSDLVGAKIH